MQAHLKLGEPKSVQYNVRNKKSQFISLQKEAHSQSSNFHRHREPIVG